MTRKKQKLYCYVDETGQDTKGSIFIVSIVVSGKEKDQLLELCDKIEYESGKGKFKWGKAENKYRLDYLKRIFSLKIFKNKLRYCIYRNQVDYDMATVMAIARAVQFKKPTGEYTTLIYVDGLKRSKRHEYSSRIRKLGIPTRKVQGVTKDENNALTRLADAIAGFVRDVLDQKEKELETIFENAISSGSLIKV